MEYDLIDTYDKAVERGFPGSPTVLLDGVDPFAGKDATPGLACRIYQTDAGPAGSPSIDHLRRAIVQAATGDSNGDQP